MKAFIKEKKFIVVAVIALIIISAIGIAIFVKNNNFECQAPMFYGFTDIQGIL